MERRHRKTFYSVSNAVLGFFTGLIGWAVVYSNMWLRKLKRAPFSELAVVFSEDLAAEKQMMTEIRLVGSVLLLALVPLLALSGYRYINVCERPEWELKKGLGGSLVMLVGGAAAWVLVGNLSLRASAVSAVVTGAGMTFATAALLGAWDDSHPTGGSGDSTENYCTRCGTPAEPKDAYCGDCGARL